jgi:hypothetical protein
LFKLRTVAAAIAIGCTGMLLQGAGVAGAQTTGPARMTQIVPLTGATKKEGAGNLLGNLLCGITGILNPPTLTSTPVGQLTQILNALLALSPRTA